MSAPWRLSRCAEAGHFDLAITNAQKARIMALRLGQIENAARDEQLLELYQAGKPFHETIDSSSSATSVRSN